MHLVPRVVNDVQWFPFPFTLYRCTLHIYMYNAFEGKESWIMHPKHENWVHRTSVTQFKLKSFINFEFACNHQPFESSPRILCMKSKSNCVIFIFINGILQRNAKDFHFVEMICFLSFRVQEGKWAAHCT